MVPHYFRVATYGWRISELLTMKVGHIDLTQRVIRLDLGTTKIKLSRNLIIGWLHRKNISLCRELCVLRSGYNYRRAHFLRVSRYAG